MTLRKRIITLALLVVMCVSMGGALFSAFSVRSGAAESTSHSNVLDDLEKDDKFSAAYYQDNTNDHSLQIIQIAESSTNDLLIYVYQPSASTKFLIATSLVMATQEDVSDRVYEEYDLSLTSSHGVFQKYIVKDFAVATEDKRTYAISEIFRRFDDSIDPKPTDDNTITHKAYGVGQMWTVTSNSGSVSYEVINEDVIDVESKHVGYIDYDGGFWWFDEDVYSHYVAFSTDHEIDCILEVDISYVYKTVFDYGYSKKEDGPFDVVDTLYAEEVFEVNVSGFFKEAYEYNRIQSIDEFLENEGTEKMHEDLADKEWVLRFFESETEWGLTYNPDSFSYTGYNKWSEVSEVALFRIMYEYKGIIYNLGVVDDKQSGDKFADGEVNPETEEWWQKIMMLLCIITIVVILTFLSGPLRVVFKIIGTGFIYIAKLLFWIITIPFRIIGAIIRSK